MEATFFAEPAAFRDWLHAHHATDGELIVGFYRVASGKPSITWSEAVDEALCYGWIDGIRHRLSDEAYSIRFTPRRKGSIWSRVNQEKIAALTAAGRMQPAGIAAWDARDPAKLQPAGAPEAALDGDMQAALRSQPLATAWNKLPPSYRKTTTTWIMTAKREETRQRRFEQLLASIRNQKRLF